MNVHACLEVDARHEKVLVTFKIENRGERRVWLPRAIAADTALKSRLFDLRRFPGDAAVAYTGPAHAQGEATPDDYVELAPHSAHTHTIDVTPYYRFESGEHTYQVRWAGRVVPDMRQPGQTAELATAAVMYSHVAP